MRLDIVNSPLTITPAPSPANRLPDTPTAPAAAGIAPASSVSISNQAPSPERDTYTSSIDVIHLRKQIDETEAQSQFTQSLATELGKARAAKAPASTSRFFRQLGALSRTTNDYKNEARSFKVMGNKAQDIGKLDFTTDRGATIARTNLNIRTRAGDAIDVRMEHRRGTGGESVEFSFTVTGHLSKAEQDALEKLAQKLGEVADEFFRTGSSELRGLEEFDQEAFASFHLDISKPKGDKLVTTSYDYSVDERGRHLHAVDADGYRIDINTALQNLVSSAQAANRDALQAYLDIVQESLNRFNSPVGNARFVRDGFASLFGPATGAASNRVMDAFATGLPDFDATIKAPVIRDIELDRFPESFELKLSQQTRQEQVQNHHLIKQVNRYELTSHRIKGLPGQEDGDLKHGDFIYDSIHEQRETARLLDMTRSSISMMTEEKSEKDNSQKTYRKFGLVDEAVDRDSQHKVSRLLHTAEASHQGLELVDDLVQSRKRLFIPLTI